MKNIAKSLLLTFTLLISSCGHTHTYSDEWSYDDNNHWHAATCEHTEEKKDFGPHTFSSWTIDIEPTSDHQGHKFRDCTLCSYREEESIDPVVHYHTFYDTWTSSETHHWHDASCGHNAISYYEEHQYGDWIIDKDAIDGKEGLKHRVCSVCEYVDKKYFAETERIYLPNNSIDVLTSYTAFINPIVIPATSEVNYKYYIEDPTLISITNGVIRGEKAGSTIVKVYDDKNNNDLLDDNEVYAVAGVGVTQSNPNVSLQFEKNKYELDLDDIVDVKYTLTGASYKGTEIGYYSDNTEVCSFSGGKLIAHKSGFANISLSWKGYRASVPVEVSASIGMELRADEIEFHRNQFILEKGDSVNIGAHLLPFDAKDTITSYSSLDEEIAIVDEKGEVTALKAGTTYITVHTSRNALTDRVLIVVTDIEEKYTESFYNDYYGDLTWENGEDLKQKLHDIISQGVTPLRYSQPNWETNQFADQDLFDHSMVNAVYSNDPIAKNNTTKGWQREHAFAASLMTGFTTGAAVSQLGRATDFHNLFAADAGGNTSRGNKNFGYANSFAADYKVQGECGYVRTAFEPNDTDKGRLARAIFYMGVMYNTIEDASIKETWTYKGEDAESHSGKSKTLTIASKEQPIEIIEDTVDFNKVSLDKFMYPEELSDVTLVNYYRDLALKADPSLSEGSDEHRQKAYEIYTNESMPYSIGNLSTLLEWNSFEVDYLEMQHNESVYSHNSSQGKGTQGNRNPFVDYPQLVEYVYGDLKDQPGSIKNLRPTYISLEMDKDDIHHYAYDSSTEVTFNVGDTFDLRKYDIKAINYDLSERTTDYSKFEYTQYTFTDADSGKTMYFTIQSDRNTFKVAAKVEKSGGGEEGAESLEDCSYYYLPSSGNKGDYVGSGKNYVATFGSEIFDVTFENENTTMQNNSTPPGTTIGYNKDGRAISATFVSRTSFTNVDSIYFYACGGASSNYSYTIKVGSTTVNSGAIKGNTPTYYGGILDGQYDGKVTLEFKGLTEALKFFGIGINYN